MERKNKNGAWQENKTKLLVISVIVAIFAWIFAALSASGTIAGSVDEVPLDIVQLEGTLEELGLSIISIENTSVKAEIRGDRVTIGQVSADDIDVTLQLPLNLNDTGKYEFKVVPVSNTNILEVTGSEFQIQSFTPSRIGVTLDRIETKTFAVAINGTSNIKLEQGHILGKDPAVTPKEVVVSGPRAELDKIDSVAVNLNLQATLSKSYAAELPVVLLDAQGTEIDLQSHHLSLDKDSVQIVISVLKTTELPLTIGFLNEPRSFPSERLGYKVSNEKIRVAGPSDTIDRYSELVVGFVDLSAITLERNLFTFEVELPESFINLGNILNVTVEVDVSNMAQEVFHIDNGSILVTNVPDGYEVDLVTSQISNVRIIGDKEIVGALTANDIVVELNMADRRDISAGQYQVPVNISVPAKGVVWASGEYTVVIAVTSLEESG